MTSNRLHYKITDLKLEVFSEDIPHAVLWYSKLWNEVALRYKWYHVGFHVSCLVYALHGVWCCFRVGTLAYCCTCRLVHKWINEALRSLWAKPKSITSKCIGCMYVS